MSEINDFIVQKMQEIVEKSEQAINLHTEIMELAKQMQVFAIEKEKQEQGKSEGWANGRKPRGNGEVKLGEPK